MKTALDTNILSGLLATTPQTPVISAHLALCRRQGSLVISPPVYAESLAHPSLPTDLLREFFSETGLKIDFQLDESIWTLAGVRSAGYAARRRKSTGQSPRRLLADFLIGAHTLARCNRLMTYDTGFYELNFPEVDLYPLPGV